MDLATIQPVLDWIAQNPNLSGLIVFLIAAGESLALVGIVVPGVVFMLGIGALVGLNAIDLWHAMVFAALGAVTGDAVSYWLGRHFDQQLRHIWPLSRYPQLIPKGERFFKRHGGISVLFGRFVGPLRPIIPAIAGIMHMPQGKFYVINVVSAVLWAPVVILPGVAFGESIHLASEVFGKLIIVIVALIIFGVLLGYLLKWAFSYTLMVSMEALGEFFGLRGHRENMFSLALMGSLVGAMVFFVYQYDIRYQPMANKQQATDYQWWQNSWQMFSKTHTKHKSDFPITLQWWGEIEEIKKTLLDAAWTPATKLNMKNSLNYFLPTAESTKLPAMTEKLFNHKDALIMVAKNKESDDYLVLRFWAANPHIEPGNKQLWLGTVYGVSLFSPFDIVHLPLRQVNYSESVLRFNDSLAQLKSDLLVRKKQYANIGISYSWRGEVLLLEFSGNHQSTAIGQEKTHLVRQQLGASNMTIMSPLTFRKKQLSLNELDSTQYAQQAAYQYESNGVRIFVEHDQYRNKYPSLSDVRTQLRNQLRSRPELELISFDESPIQVGDISGTRFTTQYQMMPFAKQVTYQVQFLMQDKNIWLVTGSYKNCDTRGKQLVNAMLDSISIISHPLN